MSRESPMLADLRQAGASSSEVAHYLILRQRYGRSGAVLRLISDICRGTRYGPEERPSEILRDMRRVHGLIRRLADLGVEGLDEPGEEGER